MPAPNHVLVIGSGLAGINAALLASEFADVTLLSKSALAETNTQRAQGGIAAAIAALDDPRIHAADTIRAGAGLCDPDAVDVLTTDGATAIERLRRLGVNFDRDRSGQLSLATEGAHSTPRVLHAGGDQTGIHIQSALVDRLAEAEVDVRTSVAISDLAIEAGRCVGAITDRRETILADATILATGGAGALYRTTTNPPNATGDGIALAFRAGAVVRDLEFVQFHPTALVSDESAFLVSEALRGEGAVLLDAEGDRFMTGIHPDAELAPRSVVARAITETMRRDATDHVWLDISHRDPDFLRNRFPGVYRGAMERGHDITTGPIPSPRPLTITWAASTPTSMPGPRCPASTPPENAPRPEPTEPIASPPTHCSRPPSSPPGPSTPSVETPPRPQCQEIRSTHCGSIPGVRRSHGTRCARR